MIETGPPKFHAEVGVSDDVLLARKKHQPRFQGLLSSFLVTFIQIKSVPRVVLWLNCVNTVFAVIFADPQREVYKFHFLLGKLSAETNFNFPAPPFNYIYGICKNLADTWPAATRVLSRGRNREDPVNEFEKANYKF